MKIPFNKAFKADERAMEEIGFIYVFALSVLLLSAVFYTIRDSTSVQKKSVTKSYLEDQVRLISGVVQDIIDLRITNPEINYSRVLDLRTTSQIYQFRIEFTRTTITLISRFEEITAFASIYNPQGLDITPKVESDASALMFQYYKIENLINVQPVDPSKALG